MKYLLCSITTFVLFCSFSFPVKKEKKILFVGNNTIHDIPDILQKMFIEQHLDIKVEQLTPIGIDLAAHSMSVWHSTPSDNTSYATRIEEGQVPTTVKKILSEHWDMVILHELEINTLIPEINTYISTRAAKSLDSTIKKVKGKTVLYEACTQNKYPKRYCLDDYKSKFDEFGSRYQIPGMKIKKAYCSDSFRNSKEELKVIQSFNSQLERKINAGIVKVGSACEACKKQYPEIPLYENNHNDMPSKQGSYLAACVLYRYITKMKLENVKYSAGVSEEQARKIRQLVDSF